MGGQKPINIGVNNGRNVLLFSYSVGNNRKVYAFEPQNNVFGKLRTNLNDKGIKNLITYRLSLRKANSLLVVHNKYFKVEENSIPKIEISSSNDRIPVITFDNYVEEIRSDLLKFDPEEREIHILRGSKKIMNAKRPNNLSLQIESDFGSKELSFFFVNIGYNFDVIVDDGTLSNEIMKLSYLSSCLVISFCIPLVKNEFIDPMRQ